MENHKIIIAGGRDFNDYELLEKIIAEETKDIPQANLEIVSGMANGADFLGGLWAKKYGIPIIPFYADWNKYGKGAGPIRNKLMADYGTSLIAFWDGYSKGTKGMIEEMKLRGKPYKIIQYQKT